MSIDKNNQTYKKTSFLTGVNSDYIEEYYALYIQNPKLLTDDWVEFFDGLKGRLRKYFTKHQWPKLESKKKTKNIIQNIKSSKRR